MELNKIAGEILALQDEFYDLQRAFYMNKASFDPIKAMNQLANDEARLGLPYDEFFDSAEVQNFCGNILIQNGLIESEIEEKLKDICWMAQEVLKDPVFIIKFKNYWINCIEKLKEEERLYFERQEMDYAAYENQNN